MGLAAPAHAQLAEPAAGIPLRSATTLTATARCPEIVDFIAGYAKSISAPVRTHTTVTSVRSDGAGYLLRTDRGDWRCRTVVIASGACNIARVPSFAASVPPSVATLTAQSYRNPAPGR